MVCIGVEAPVPRQGSPRCPSRRGDASSWNREPIDIQFDRFLTLSDNQCPGTIGDRFVPSVNLALGSADSASRLILALAPVPAYPFPMNLFAVSLYHTDPATGRLILHAMPVMIVVLCCLAIAYR